MRNAFIAFEISVFVDSHVNLKLSLLRIFTLGTVENENLRFWFLKWKWRKESLFSKLLVRLFVKGPK